MYILFTQAQLLKLTQKSAYQDGSDSELEVDDLNWTD